MIYTHVVIVDDEVDHAVISRMVLAQVAPGLDVETHTDLVGLEVRLHAVPQDALVIVDRMLGRVESFDLVRALKRVRPDLTVVLVSAVLTPEDRRRALESGASDTAEKPGDLEGWRALFRRLLSGGDGSASKALGGVA
ncbi:MAG: hypothetical protein AMXMBFR23_26000 [Chloroflexota bacterium]